MSNTFDFMGFRAAEDPSKNVQLNVDPLITQLVTGTEQSTFLPGMAMLKQILVPNFNFEYRTFGTEHLDHYDTKRAMRAPIKHGDWEVNTVPDRLERYGFRILRDADEIGNAHPSLSVRELSAELARRIVTLDIEREIRDLVELPASYLPAQDTTLGGGAEWNSAGGDSRADIRAMASLMVVGLPITTEDIEVFLPYQSLEAAKDDPVFLAARRNFDTDTPTLDALRLYWGVGRVWTANPIDKNQATGVIGPMYADEAIMYYPGGARNLDTTYGETTWAVNFRYNKGIAAKAYWDDLHTSWSFPWHDYAAPRIINSAAAAIIRNTVA